MLLDHSLQRDQTPVKKMAGARKHDHRKHLRPRPVEHVFQRNDIIFLAMHDQRIFRHIANRKAPDRGRRQYQVPRRKSFRRDRRDETAEGKPADREFAFAVSTLPVRCQREEILDFAAPFVEYAVTCADTAKIQPQRAITQRGESLLTRLSVEQSSLRG